MSSAITQTEVGLVMPQALAINEGSTGSLTVEALANEHTEEVLDFLSVRPIHTVCMAGYIRDHGIVSPLNRGIFYGCRSREGSLKGVALIGHATLLETQSDAALKAFAQLNNRYATSHVIRGEHDVIARFWRYYSEFGHEPRLACRESLFEQQTVPPVDGPMPQLRAATADDLVEIMKINAAMILSECGVDPLKKDAAGFRERLARRIQHGRVWVWVREGKLVFKADIFAQTPEMSYVEGVNVHPEQRGQGHGSRCISRLGQILLQRSRSVCLLVNEHKKELAAFYERSGYEFRGTYDTIYLLTEN